jgi:hypothetical protein
MSADRYSSRRLRVGSAVGAGIDAFASVGEMCTVGLGGRRGDWGAVARSGEQEE